MKDRKAPPRIPNQDIQSLIDQGFMQVFTDEEGEVRLRLTDKGWAIAEQQRKEGVGR